MGWFRKAVEVPGDPVCISTLVAALLPGVMAQASPRQATEVPQHPSAASPQTPSTGEFVKQPNTSPSISKDGNLIVYQSRALYLIAEDTNQSQDIYLYDRSSKSYSLVSATSDRRAANSDSFDPVVSADGRFVAFFSEATNLVEPDSNGCSDIFLWNRLTRETSRVSNGLGQAPTDKPSREPSISADGSKISFHSTATNLVTGDVNRAADVFLFDSSRGLTTCVSVNPDGKPANKGSGDGVVSADGRFVAFFSHATDVVPEDRNKKADVFLRDLVRGTTQRISTGYRGEGNNQSRYPSISADGRIVAFESFADNLVEGDDNQKPDVFLFDTKSKKLERVLNRHGDDIHGGARYPVLSPDGQFVAFESLSDDLVPGDTNDHHDVFVLDRKSGKLTRISVSSEGVEGNHASGQPMFTGDGRYVVFGSKAKTLYANDTNKTIDILLHDRKLGTTVPISKVPGPKK